LYCYIFPVEEDTCNAWIKSVVRCYFWTIKDIENLYLDAVDYQGLEYWYEDAKEMNKKE
jgi:hypothetical protein